MDLLGRINLHLRRSDVTATRFGRDCVNDPRLVFDLRRGRQPRPRLAARIIAFLDARETGEEPPKPQERNGTR